MLALLLAAVLSSLPVVSGAQTPVRSQPTINASPAKAKYLITAADDFIVEVYHNGKNVPASRREILEERFGATAERINIEVQKGDWLVFNVVNNRLRWGGVSYFGVAGCFAFDEFGFVSERETGNWSVCDTYSDVDRFISDRTFFRHRPAMEIGKVWEEGDRMMRQYAGSRWNGVPVWGATRNTWVKVLID